MEKYIGFEIIAFNNISLDFYVQLSWTPKSGLIVNLHFYDETLIRQFSFVDIMD